MPDSSLAGSLLPQRGGSYARRSSTLARSAPQGFLSPHKGQDRGLPQSELVKRRQGGHSDGKSEIHNHFVPSSPIVPVFFGKLNCSAYISVNLEPALDIEYTGNVAKFYASFPP